MFCGLYQGISGEVWPGKQGLTAAKHKHMCVGITCQGGERKNAMALRK